MGERERRPYLLQAGEGESVWSLGARITMKVPDGAADGRFALAETLMFRTAEPPLHIHRREDEAWYVLNGGMTFYVADEVFTAPSGSFVFAPRGIPHNFTVDVEPTRVLLFASPAGFERFAFEFGEPAVTDEPPPGLAIPDPDVLGPIAERYGIEVVGPPRRVHQ